LEPAATNQAQGLHWTASFTSSLLINTMDYFPFC
jgi:hypothetical protein